MNYLKLNIAIQKLLKIQDFDKEIENYINSPKFSDLVDYFRSLNKLNVDQEYIISNYFASLCNCISYAYYLDFLFDSLHTYLLDLFDSPEFFDGNSTLTYRGTNDTDDQDEYEHTELYDNVSDFLDSWCQPCIVEAYQELNK